MNKTWVLFEDGSKTRVDCRVSSPMGARDTVSAYVIPDPGSAEVIKAADSGVNAVHNWCMARGMKSDAVVAKFAFEGREHLGASMSGLSGGVSFALCFARTYLGTSFPNIAATGAIDGHETVVAINGIASKAAAALSILSSGDYFLYPRANHGEIPVAFLDALAAKGVHCHGIDTISQALDTVLGYPGAGASKPSRSSSFKITLLTLALFLAVLILSFFLFRKENPPAPPETRESIENTLTSEGRTNADQENVVVPEKKASEAPPVVVPDKVPPPEPVQAQKTAEKAKQVPEQETMKKVVIKANESGFY